MDAEDNQTFRRSRTITGTTSSQIDSASPRRAQIQSPRLKTHDLRHHRRLIAGLLLLVLVAAGAVVWLLDQYIASPRIAYMTPVDASFTARYEGVFHNYFAEHPLQRFDFSLSRSGLQAYIDQQAPEVTRITLTNTPGLAAHDVLVEFRTPLVRWQLHDNTQYIVDSQGMLFTTTPLVVPALTVKDESGLPAASQQIASRRMMQFIGQTVGAMAAQHQSPVQEVIIPAGTLRRIDLVLQGRAYPFRLSIDRDPARQVTDLVAAVRYIDAHNVLPQYVDIRVEGKAFYRE